MNVEFIFSEFRERNISNSYKALGKYGNKYRLDPTYSSIKQYFPDAKITVYTDQEHIGDVYTDVDIRLIDVDKSPFDKNNKRWGWHCCDYYQVDGLLKSKADIAISVDSDLMFVSNEVKTLLPITKNFGFCTPQNPRQFVKIDAIHTRGNDGDYHVGEDESMGNILTYDLWWMSLYTKDKNGRKFYEKFMELMADNPKRGPLQLSRAAWDLHILVLVMK